MSESSISTNYLSKYGKFTINSIENENSKQNIGENGDIHSKIHREAIKPVKRAPLGEFQQVNLCTNADVQHRLHQIPAKKRAERFEIFADEDKGNGEEQTDPTKENGENTQQYSPGKENIAPVEPELEFNGKHLTSEKSFDSFEDVEDESDENSPSEYLTAKSSLILLSTKPKPPEKSSMYICYDKDIYSWMLYREGIHRPRIGYMSKQSEINEEMRKVLIDWFVDVAEEFEISRSSFFLSVFLTDRALSKIDCPRDKLQLLGVTSILIATKIQEIFPPQIKDIVYVTDDSYTEDQVRRMEKIILKVVDFQLNVPLVDCFAEYFDNFSASPLSPMAHHLMWYFLELSALEFKCIHFLPSHLAAAGFILASHFQQLWQEGAHGKIWSNEIEDRMRIKRTDLVEPAKTLLQLHKKASLLKSQSVRKKYASSKRCRVANILMPEFKEFASHFNKDDD